MAAGNYFLVRRQRQGKPSGDFHEEWHLRLKFPGKPEKLMNSGYDICPKCMASPDVAALRARESCACRGKAIRSAKMILENWNDDRMIRAFEQAKMKRTVASLDDIYTAYTAPGVRILKDAAAAKRNVNSHRRVVAFALGLWRVHEGGIPGVRIGALVADEIRIGKLPATVMTAELREGYLRAAQTVALLDPEPATAREWMEAYQEARTEGQIDWNEPQEGNTNINSTLAHAMDIFSKNSRYHKLKGLELPDLDGFLKGPWLPEEQSKPEPLTVPQWEAMLKAAAVLKRTHFNLWVVNLLFRQTGLRSAYAVGLHGSWLVKQGRGWFLEIQNRTEPKFRKKRGTRDQLIPLGRTLAAALLRQRRKGPWLVMPLGSENERKDLVNLQHNAWLKKAIGLAGGTGQGNHRLRDTVASVLWSVDCPTAAQEALGHASVDTTAKHYGKKIHVCASMREEMAAWL